MGDVRRIALHPAKQGGMVRKAVLDGVDEGVLCLVFEACAPSVPKLRGEIGGVHQGRGVARAFVFLNPLCHGTPVRQDALRLMTARATDRAIGT
jgi:hypothetical protein